MLYNEEMRAARKRNAWAGSMIDPEKLVWLDLMRKNSDPNFVDDDPSRVSTAY